MNPARISPELDAIVERLRTTRRVAAPRPADQFVLARVWMPELEDESAAMPLRLKGLRAIVAFRHALAVGQRAWPRRIECRVLVRDAEWTAHAFDARFIGPRFDHQLITRIARCCRICGCTDDRACPMPDGRGCNWARVNVCSACADG